MASGDGSLMMLLSAEMPVDAMADLFDEHDTRLWRVLMHYVEQAHAKSDWSAGQALDGVRRELQREGAELKGALWSLRGNAWNLSEERQEQRKNLCRQYTKLGRAMSLRETLQAIYANSNRQVAEA